MAVSSNFASRSMLKPGTIVRPTSLALALASTLSPITRIVSGLGPMKTKPLASTFSAKSAFSDRKP